MAFETLRGGHFGEDAIFLCHVMLFPHLTLATLSPQSAAPAPPPPLFSGAPARARAWWPGRPAAGRSASNSS